MDRARRQLGRGRRRATETGGGFRDIFSQFFGRGQGQEAEPEKGGDLEYVMDIDFWQNHIRVPSAVSITSYRNLHATY